MVGNMSVDVHGHFNMRFRNVLIVPELLLYLHSPQKVMNHVYDVIRVFVILCRIFFDK